ncbi:MAG TPA: AAA family ATPase, partial [Kofleriaceae bacterium]|nr:AAA family ATPase [Kofleriaceae bacterium]
GAVGTGDAARARLAVSVGVHTGLVAHGDLDDLEGARLVTGATPRRAMRLAAQAAPGTVVVSAASQRLLRTAFELSGDGDAFQLVKEVRDTRSGDLTTRPLSGREPELGLLLERWRRTGDGTGQAILITGEPGIGKSRLARALHERMAHEPHVFLEARCSPTTKNSALAPIAEMLERALGLDQESEPAAKIARLERALAEHGVAVADTMPLLLPVFALPLQAPYAALDVSPARHKALTLQAITSVLFALAERATLLVLVEDLHWADATTMELLMHLLRELPQVPICLVMTARPELTPPFSLSEVLMLPLTRLEAPQISDMLARLASARALPPSVVDYVAQRADGVPLFVEELFRMMIDAGILAERDHHYELIGSLTTAEVPGTLRALLTARLDRLARAKETAQLAAALGREFNLDMLLAASPLGTPVVMDDLERLTRAGLVQRKRRGKETIGVFKHALVRDAAYESLSTSARQKVHARIAHTVEDRFPEIARTRPELLAYHHAAAEQKPLAIGYAHQAALTALQRSACEEAINHVSAARGWLAALPADGPRVDRELDLDNIELQALSSTQGWASIAVRTLGEQARARLAAATTPRHTVPVLFGLYMHYHVASERAQARQIADELIRFAEQIADEGLQAVALTARGVSLHAEGRFVDAEHWLERGRAMYAPARDRAQGTIFGMDCRVWATAQLALVQWGLGRPSRARALAHEAIAWAREIHHVPSLGIALLYLSQIHQMANDKAGARQSTGELLAAAATYGLPAFEGYAATIASWAAGDPQGVATIIEILKSLRCFLILTYYGSFLVDLAADAGDVEAAIAHAEAYLAMCGAHDEHMFEAELLRRRAGLELRRAAPDRELARARLGEAIALARTQGMARFEVAALRDLERAFPAPAHAARLHEIFQTRPELETEETSS